MSKLLIIAYAFPPIPYSGTYRILRLCKGLDALGVEVHVLTINIDKRIPNDFELMDRLPDSTQVHRSAIPDPWLWFQAWKKRRRTEGFVFRGLTKIFNAFFRALNIPDHQILWVPFAVRHGTEIVRKYDISNVLVTAPPYSSLFCGSILKRLKGVRFIADLRDPIVGNIAQVDLINPKGFYSKLVRKVHEELEQHVMRVADIVIANTATHQRELKKKYQIDKVEAIRNSFDPDDYKGLTQEKFKKFTIAHIGGLYGLRNADLLFQAVNKLKKAFGTFELQVVFVGPTSDKIKKAVDTYQLNREVRFISRVPHKIALEIMHRSHLLLLVKATGEGSLGQIPAKFFEYLGAQNQIICIADKQSEVAQLIREANIGITVENDANELADFLISEYKKYLDCKLFLSENRDMKAFNLNQMAIRVKRLLR